MTPDEAGINETQILSAFHEPLPAAAPVAPPRRLVFDACSVGVVLRAVIFVEVVMAVGTLFGAPSATVWLARLSLITGGTLPATLAWLILACGLKKYLAKWPRVVQYLVGIALGASAGLYGCGLLNILNLVDPVPWGPSAVAGALLSVLLVVGLELRARGRMPADTAARLAELQSRIRPHFLFNTLNSAVALVRAEPAKAEALLEDLADLFHHALAEQGESTTLAEEITLAERYLAIEEVRFGERLRVSWQIDPAAGAARLPPMLLQPLVENAVKHGVEPSAEGADISIITELRGAQVVVKVSNTVPGGPGARGNGLALANVRDRLRLLHDVEGEFRATFRKGVFQVRIEFPMGAQP